MLMHKKTFKLSIDVKIVHSCFSKSGFTQFFIALITGYKIGNNTLKHKIVSLS